MSRFDLPEGVPADNEGLTTASRYAAPDMATPQFGGPQISLASFDRTKASHDVVIVQPNGDSGTDGNCEEELEECESDRERLKREINQLQKFIFILIAVIALGLIFFAYRYSGADVEPEPYCSQQPEWNQYNCIPG